MIRALMASEDLAMPAKLVGHDAGVIGEIEFSGVEQIALAHGKNLLSGIFGIPV